MCVVKMLLIHRHNVKDRGERLITTCGPLASLHINELEPDQEQDLWPCPR